MQTVTMPMNLLDRAEFVPLNEANKWCMSLYASPVCGSTKTHKETLHFATNITISTMATTSKIPTFSFRLPSYQLHRRVTAATHAPDSTHNYSRCSRTL